MWIVLFLRGTPVLLFRENFRKEFLHSCPFLSDAGRHPMQIHPGCNLEGILTEVSAVPGGSQQHSPQAQPLATVRDGANIRARTANPLPDTHFDRHPSWVLRFQLLAVGPHHLYVSHIHNRNRFAGLAEKIIVFAHFSNPRPGIPRGSPLVLLWDAPLFMGSV